MDDRRLKSEIEYYNQSNQRLRENVHRTQTGTAFARWMDSATRPNAHPIVVTATPACIPQFLRKTAPASTIAELVELLDSLHTLRTSMAGLTGDEASILHQEDPRADAIRLGFNDWTRRHVQRRLARRHPKDRGDPVNTFFRLQGELVEWLDLLTFEPASGHHVSLGVVPDLAATLLYYATWRPLVECRIVEGGTSIQFDASAQRIDTLMEVMRLYGWHIEGLVDAFHDWSSPRLRPSNATDSHLLAADLMEMKPLLIRGFTMDRFAFEHQGVHLSMSWSLGTTVSICWAGRTERRLLEQIHGSFVTSGIGIARTGRATHPNRQWEEDLASRRPWATAILEALHERAFEFWSKAEHHRSRADRSDPLYEAEAIATSCLDLAEDAPEDTQPLQDSSDVSPTQKLRKRVPAVRMERLLGMLESRLGCEVKPGKGSEVTVYRPGGVKFVLGHHHRNRHVPSHLVRLLLKRVGISVEEWLRAV